MTHADIVKAVQEFANGDEFMDAMFDTEDPPEVVEVFNIQNGVRLDVFGPGDKVPEGVWITVHRQEF